MAELSPEEKRAKNLRIVAYACIVFGSWTLLLSLAVMALDQQDHETSTTDRENRHVHGDGRQGVFVLVLLGHAAAF